MTVIGNAVGHKYPSFSKKLVAVLDKNGDGQVSIAEAQVFAADSAPAQTAEQQNATVQAALQLLQDKDGGSVQLHPDTVNLFRGALRIPVSTCLARIYGHPVQLSILKQVRHSPLPP